MNDTTTSTPTEQQQRPPGERDVCQQVPLWRITGTFTLVTPLHVGTGRDAGISLANDDPDRADESRYVATVVRDHLGQPCIPASSFKGALAGLARRVGVADETCRRLFGTLLATGKSQAGLVEFTYLYADQDSLAKAADTKLPQFGREGHPHVANIAHVSRNRDTGTAEAQRLFLSQVVPPGVKFEFECVARGVTEGEVSALLGLLVRAGEKADGLRLGAGKAADQGRVCWHFGDVQCIESLAGLWKAAGNATLWDDKALIRKVPAEPPPDKNNGWLTLDGLALEFHSPFLVYERSKKEKIGDADGSPRLNHAGHAVLPSTSLHGALRAQAERILRTIGRETPAGYEVPGVQGLDDAGRTLDLASVLFGAPGWRSLLRCSDFVDGGTSKDITHHMLAIDRLTGGGKDSAKFSVTVRDCPTLNGSLAVDMVRLQAIEAKRPGVTAQVLGLLAHVLRDLDEGDIPLGYGASKGYGQLSSGTADTLRTTLRTAMGREAFSQALAAFADLSAQATASCSAAELVKPELTPEEHLPPPSASAGPDTFHNPYAFIPFGTPRPDDTRLPWADRAALDKGQAANHSHARYAADAFHGRIVCRVTAKTPIFIGAGDKEKTSDPKEKLNYQLGGRCALPATSLRGMVSSLHESITASRLRAATDRHYSVRYDTNPAWTKRNPSAIGRLIRLGDRFWLQMLALPTLKLLDPQGVRAVLEEPGYQHLVRGDKPAPLKSLFANGDINSDSLKKFLPESGKKFRTTKMERRVDAEVKVDRNNKVFVDFDSNAELHRRGPYVLGAKRYAGEEPLDLKFDHGQKRMERGLVRVMQADGRKFVESNENQVRTHEVFVPFDMDQQKDVENAAAIIEKNPSVAAKKLEDMLADLHILPVPQDCVDRFHRLADEMTAQQDNKAHDDLHKMAIRPFHPNGTTRNNGVIENVYASISQDNHHRVLRLQHNDLVYFRPNAEGTAIEEISYSSMWRREIGLTTKDLVGHGEWMPDGTKSVSHLSPSELLFGALEVRPVAGDKEREPVAAWMSKVRFSAGISLEQIRPDPAVTLKILSSPKPPSPSMYFENIDQEDDGKGYVSKAELWNHSSQYQIKGRKIYLHAHQNLENPSASKVDGKQKRKILSLDDKGYHKDSRNPWESHYPSKDVKQKVKISPLPVGSEFHFSIDFHNLSQPELESLCASLRPHADFEHKIGIGKPIGLGSVKVETAGLHLVDRLQRYRQRDFASTPRYHAQWIDGRQHLPKFMSLEANVSVSSPPAVRPEHLARACMDHLKAQSPAVHRALVLTGDPKHVIQPVHYPQLQNRSIEQETFAWFVNNDKTGQTWQGQQQHLTGFTADSRALPTLSRVPRT